MSQLPLPCKTLGPVEHLRTQINITSSWIVFGAHMSPEARCSEITARIPGLHTWCRWGVGVSDTVVPKSAEGPAARRYEVSGIPDENYAIPQLGLTVIVRTARRFSGDLNTEHSIKTETSLTLRSYNPRLFWELFEILESIETLLAIQIGSSIAPDMLAGIAEDLGEINVLVALRDSKTCLHQKPDDYFMTQQSMGVPFETVLVNWFGLPPSLKIPARLAVASLYDSAGYLYIQFLSLFQALEGFHRAMMRGLYMDPEEYTAVANAIVSAIPAQVSPDHRASLKSRIRYGNNYSLRKMMGELAERLSLNNRQFILGEKGEIPNRWIQARHYHTHWDEDLLKDVLNGEEMHEACVRIEVAPLVWTDFRRG